MKILVGFILGVSAAYAALTIWYHLPPLEPEADIVPVYPGR